MAQIPSIVSKAQIDAASRGNQAALKSMLNQLANAANTQATQTNTSGKQPPDQSTAAVVFQNPFYIVTFTDPGGATAASPTQAAQQAASSTLGSNPTQSVIYHQVQAATSVLFDVPSGLTTYGGDTGSLQTQFVLNGLSTTKSWYFRIRTSFDGVNWNQWKILSKSGTTVNANAVTLEVVNGGQFAAITLPGSQIVGFSVGKVANGAEIQTADGVLLATTLGIGGPSGFTDAGQIAQGVQCVINSLGVATLKYQSGGGQSWPGVMNFLTFGWKAGAQDVTTQVLGDGSVWVVLTLAGGARVAIGSGLAANGTTIDVPAGFTVANSMGVCTPAQVNPTAGDAHGILQSNVVAGLVTCEYACRSGISTSTASWMAIAWEPALSGNLVAVGGGQYIGLPTPSGVVMVGVGSTVSAGIMPLPPGYTYPKCLAFSTPGSLSPGYSGGWYMHGVQACAIDAGLSTSIGTAYCIYGDGGGNTWAGSANWLAVAWL